jgi:hypothetical protein
VDMSKVGRDEQASSTFPCLVRHECRCPEMRDLIRRVANGCHSVLCNVFLMP